MFNASMNLKIYTKNKLNEELFGDVNVDFNQLLKSELIKLDNSLKRQTISNYKIYDNDESKGEIDVLLSLEDLGY
jgi:hypothetical protein